MKKGSGFYSSLGLLLFLNTVIKPLWIFAIDRQVQNVVGIEAYGTYFSLFGLSLVFSFLADLGFTLYFNQQLAARQGNIFDFPGNYLVLKILLAFLYAIIVFIIAWLSGVKRWDILLYVILIHILTSLFVFFRAIATAQQWFRADAWFSITDKGLMILTCGILLYLPSLAGDITIKRFLFLQTACLAIAVLVTMGYLVKKGIRFTIQKKWLPGWKIFRRVLPFGFTVLLMGVHSRLDGFLLDRMHVNGAYEAGIYAAAYRLLDASNMAGYLVASFMLPYIARRWSEKQEIISVILNCRHFMVMMATGIVCTVVFLAPWLQQALYHHTDTYAIEILQWCLPALAGYSLVQVYGTVLTAAGRINDFLVINLTAVLVNVLLNILLIPVWGAKGCCIAALSSQFFCGIFTMLYVREKLKVPLHFRSLLIYIFTAVLLCGFYYFSINLPIGKVWLIVAATLITVAMMLLTKLAGIAGWIISWRKQVS